MVDYTTITNVSNELNGFTIDASSTPSSTTVEGWITDASREADLKTEQLWGSTLVSSEYYDYDGSGLLRLSNTPIIAISEYLTESNGLNQTPSWGTLTEGRLATDSYIVYKDEGELSFHGNTLPKAGNQNQCITYTHGYATIPTNVENLATKIAARRVIKSVVDGSATNEGGSVSVGTIRVSDPSNFGNKRLEDLNKEIDELVLEIGKLKVYRINRVYN